MQETTKTAVEKNENIENSVAKGNVRTDVGTQKQEVVNYLKMAEVTALGLPATEAYEENNFYHRMKRSGSNTKINFVGIEKSSEVTPKAYRNMPPNSKFCNSTIADFLIYKTIDKKDGYLIPTKEERESRFMFELGWFDYCGIPTNKNMEHLVDTMIHNIEAGYMAVTFDLSTRHMKPDEYAKELCGYSKGLTLEQTVVKSIEKIIKKANTNKNIDLVLKDIYGGGAIGVSTMITLGYTINIPKGVVKPISENMRIERNETKMIRANTYYKLKNGIEIFAPQGDKKDVIKINGKRGRPQIYANAEERRLKKAVEKWSKKWHLFKNRRERKENIAKRYGKSLREFGSMIAWYHMPESKVA